jgi:hypothetical protein
MYFYISVCIDATVNGCYLSLFKLHCVIYVCMYGCMLLIENANNYLVICINICPCNIYLICNTVQQANPKWFKSVRIGLTSKANPVGWAGNVRQPHTQAQLLCGRVVCVI